MKRKFRGHISKSQSSKNRVALDREASFKAVEGFKEKHPFVIDTYMTSVYDYSPRKSLSACGWSSISTVKTTTSVRHKLTYGGWSQSTQNRTMMMCLIRFLGSITKPVPLVIRTNSLYLYSGAQKWLDKWVSEGTLDSKTNVDYWKTLLLLRDRFEICWCFHPMSFGRAREEVVYKTAMLGYDKAIMKMSDPEPFVCESRWVTNEDLFELWSTLV